MVGEVKIFNKKIINEKHKRKPVDRKLRKVTANYELTSAFVKIGAVLLMAAFSLEIKGGQVRSTSIVSSDCADYFQKKNYLIVKLVRGGFY